MPTTPIYGFPYPAGSDAPAGPSQMQALATSVENTIALEQRGSAQDTIPAGSSAVEGSITFDVAYDASVVPFPIPAVYIRTSATYPSGYKGAIGVQVTTRSNTGFSYRIFTTSGANAPTGGLPVALGYIVKP